MQLFGRRNGGQNSRTSASEEWRSHHEESAQSVQQPDLPVNEGGNESKSDHTPNQIAGNHDAAPVETVQPDARERTNQNGRYRAGQHDARDHAAIVSHLDGEAKDRDVVKVIADLADDLSKPGKAIIPVRAKQRAEASAHQRLRKNENATLAAIARE